MIFRYLATLTLVLSLVSVSSVYAESNLYDILDYDVGYDIENGEILVMDLDVDYASLSIEIVSYGDGFVEIDIPRGLIDATFDGEDDVFFILIDGTESYYLEIDSSDSIRSLIIPFFIDEQEIEILGTNVLSSEPITIDSFEKIVDDKEIVNEKEGGGCLIATATYGTELASQVQFLREIRDNTLMNTVSGSSFMTGFNQVYYLFSPTIADIERESPLFQEAVKAFITPMISTLSIMTLVENGSEVEILGLGISVIVLNLGMYVVAPALIGFKVHKHIRTVNSKI